MQHPFLNKTTLKLHISVKINQSYSPLRRCSFLWPTVYLQTIYCMCDTRKWYL